jgi:hypothetical protein
VGYQLTEPEALGFYVCQALSLGKREEDEMGKGPDEGGVKDPENEAETPSSMPKAQQGQGGIGKRAHHDLEGQQGGTKGGGHENN